MNDDVLDIKLTRREKIAIATGMVVGGLAAYWLAHKQCNYRVSKIYNNLNYDLSDLFDSGELIAPNHEGKILQYHKN